MTDAEMRQRLAEAMGWTGMDLSGRWGDRLTGLLPDRHRRNLPDPLESDRDAAMLRAWLVGQGADVETSHRPGMCVVLIRCPLSAEAIIPGRGEATTREEPDPCRRERLACCRAAVQAIEAMEVRHDG